MKTSNTVFAGIDVGSRTTKAVLWDGRDILFKTLHSTAWHPGESATVAYRKILDESGVESVKRVVVTGYGRVSVDFADETITEITAHARGVAHLLPGTKTLVDIGGQDSKAIMLSEDGLVSDFMMNDRCAAGSGKFLEFLAMTMELSVQDFAALAYQSKNPVQISSICTVFAETELLSLLAEGVSRVDISAGVHRSIALRVAQMTASLHPQPPAAFSGGVARNKCMVKEMSAALGFPISVPDIPEYAGALGAAIIAKEGM